METSFQTTVGKMLTKTVVINDYAQKPTTKQILGRSLSRIVPFEALSCINGRGWHDKWSGTWVVEIKEKDKLQKLLAEQAGITETPYESKEDDLLDSGI